VYSDRAKSGASLTDRRGARDMLAAAKRGDFEVLLADSTSRIGRDQEDRAAVRKRLKLDDVAIMTPVDGVVTDLTDGIRAVIDAQYIEDLKHAIRRGMSGVVRSGRHAGGRAYGYRPVKEFDASGEPARGELEIVESEADVVRRIFEMYATGETPRAIAAALNSDGIAAPRGKRWNASTINGNTKRGTGILQNELYAGRIVWGKVRMVKNPETARRVSRANSDRTTVDAPLLRIVSGDVWRATRVRKSATASERPEQT
jgi:site-specific DNA recombinase